MPKILLPSALRRYAANAEAIAVQAGTVGQALQCLTQNYPELRPHLFDERGQLRPLINLYVGNKKVRDSNHERVRLGTSDELLILAAQAGAVEEASARLSASELARYDRHLNLPEVGRAGQEKLKAARVLMIGTGGLGSPLGLYLTAAGIGRLGVVDFDVVDESNLQRQIMHGTRDVGRPKIASARDRLSDVNPHVQIQTYETALTAANALEILKDYDVVVDGTDNFPTRYLISDACVLLGKPNVYGSIFRFEGQVSVFAPVLGGPCYRCLYPQPPPPGLIPSCAEGGVLGVLPGVIGTLQATEILKLILGVGQPLLGRLLLFDALAMQFSELKIKKDAECPICGPHASIKKLVDYREFCGLNQAGPNPAEEVSPQEFVEQWDEGRRPTLLDVRNPHEWDIVNLAEFGARLLPLDQLADQLPSLEPGADIVVQCKSGGRSAKAQSQLLAAGFTRVRNLTGGILAWSEQIDPSKRKY